MLRPELQTLASEGAHVHVCGRLLEVRRQGEHTDLMLKNCRVRKVEQGLPVTTHDLVRTDHLWIRVPTAMLEPAPAPAGCPPELRRSLERKPLQLLKVQCLLGIAGFYTCSNGELGIGITQVVPTIRDDRLQAMVVSARECFQAHPWRKECLATLEQVTDWAIDAWRTEWVMSNAKASDVIALLERLKQRARRNHQAELKARRADAQATLPGLNPLVELVNAELQQQARGTGIGISGLLRDSALKGAINRRYGSLR